MIANKKSEEEKSWKERLFQWGGSLELCSRKEREIEKLLRLKKENEDLIRVYQNQEALKTVSKMYDKEIENIQNFIIHILKEKNMVDIQIIKLSPDEQKFLYFRYEKGFSYDYIAVKTNQSRANCFRMQDKIIKKIIENIKNETK